MTMNAGLINSLAQGSWYCPRAELPTCFKTAHCAWRPKRGEYFISCGINTFLTVILQNNVLITRSGRAVLTDFGLSQVIEDLMGPSGNTTSTIQGSVRWQAPELMLDDDNNQKTKLTSSTDVWSFACTAYEVSWGFFLHDKEILVLIICCLM